MNDWFHSPAMTLVRDSHHGYLAQPVTLPLTARGGHLGEEPSLLL